jgi:hypothetical protein
VAPGLRRVARSGRACAGGQVAEVREQIGATRAAGFILSSESPPRSRDGSRSLSGTRRVGASVVVLPRSQVEAAARLGMWEEFDPNLFDALCVCLQVPWPRPRTEDSDGWGAARAWEAAKWTRKARTGGTRKAGD